MRLIKQVVALALLATLVLSGLNVASAANAKTLDWAVAVTYQNVGSAATGVTVNFYSEGSASPIAFDPLSGGTLAAGAAKSFFIGSVSGISSGFTGSAVVSASQPLVATVVQFVPTPPTGETVKMRLLSNGFQSSDASSQYLIATVLLNKFARTTVFSIQNTESSEVTVTIKFYDADNNGNLASTKTHDIPAQSSKYIDMSNTADTGLPSSTTQFNGSAIITAKIKNSSTDANIVAAASEYYVNKNVAANFEGIPLSQTNTTIYMATAVCEKFGLDTFYAVQNASLTDTTFIKVTYKDTSGNVKTTDGPYEIGPGQKKSIVTCSPSTGASMSGFTGSATIESTTTSGGSTPGANIAVIGKAQSSQNAPSPSVGPDVFTAFLGQPQGSSSLALPFVRWAKDSDFNNASNFGGKQRSYIAVQNLESSEIKVDAKYYDKDGTLVATEELTIPALSKGNSSASSADALGSDDQFGYYNDGTFGGAVTLEASSSNPSAKFIAIVRVQNPGAGEDYNGMVKP